MKRDKWLDKWDAEIMWWFYDLIKLHFDTDLVQDSTELREMLEEAKKESQKDLLDKVEKMIEEYTYTEDFGWNINKEELLTKLRELRNEQTNN